MPVTQPDEPSTSEPHLESAALFDHWSHTTPSGNYGDLALRVARADFLMAYFTALESGGVDALVRNEVADLSEVYVVKSDEAALASNDFERWHNHQPAQLAEWSQRLGRFAAQLQASTLPDLYLQAYQDQLKLEERFLTTASFLGSEQLMEQQLSPEQWRQVLDVPASMAQGMAVMPLEQLARDYLTLWSARECKRVSLASGIAHYGLGRLESDYLGKLSEERLSPTQGKRLFEILLSRLSLDDWQVKMEKNRHSLEVDAGAQTIRFPAARSLSGAEVQTLPLHELVHVVGSVNGSQQACQLLGKGLLGYLATEEGVAVLSEVMGGLDIFSERIALLAGRYLAVAMALKVKETDSGLVAKHAMQEIYATLREYGLPAAQAQKMVWRVFRGSSLRQQVVEVKVGDGDRVVSLPMAEAFVRDEAYFRGFVSVLSWLSAQKGLVERADAVTCGNTACKRACMQCLLSQKQRLEPVKQLEDFLRMNETVQGWDRSLLLSVIQYLRPGKMELSSMVGDWDGVLSRELRDGMVAYGKVFEAAGKFDGLRRE